jgi:pimeloyl-ACP methyl ester carboxylesterase
MADQRPANGAAYAEELLLRLPCALTKRRRGQMVKKPSAPKKSVSAASPRVDRVSVASSDRHESLIVYVHGIGRQAPPEQLKLEWDLALFGKDLGQRSRMAYWSDLLHPAAGPGTKSPRRRSTGSTATLDLAALLVNAGVSKENQEAQEYASALLRGFGLEQSAPSAGSKKKKSALRRPISRAFLETFVADTAAYFFRDHMRARICKRLAEQLQIPKDRPVTIVAHSQGSIVAYEVLSAMTAGSLALNALVTIGSPLGLREVQDFLQPNTLQIPSLVTRWVNFADPLDFVSMDKRLSGDFSAQPPATNEVQDELIVNSATRRLTGFNPHSALGYLAHPKVRKWVAEAMRMDVVGRFVLARDVAELLAVDDSVRHPVLIEVLEPGYPALSEARERMVEIEKVEREALPHHEGDTPPPLRLEHRIAKLAQRLRKEIVSDANAAEIDLLRRFVAARLTASELRQIGHQHSDLRVYAVWRSSRKTKHTWRSMRPIKADAALTSFGANGQGITWAVLDTGIQANHPHFEGVIKEVWDCTRRGAPTLIPLIAAKDKDGHGTHVAGIISGRRNDSGGEQGTEGQRRRRRRVDHQGAGPHRLTK